MPFLALWAVTVAITGAAAQTPTSNVIEPAATVTGVTITRAGSYAAQATNKPAQAGQESPTRTVGTVADWHFLSESTEIEGKVGTQFGIEFRIDGTPADQPVTIHLGLKFPPQGIRNPNTGNLLHDTRIAFPTMKIGALCLIGYGFDNAWEIVPGEWTLQVIYQDRVLAERTFTVSKAE
jgi:hypothetical protein